MQVAHQLKVMKAWLEGKRGRRSPGERPVMPWLVEYSAVLLNGCEVSKDGATAYRRLKGKDAIARGIVFS